MKLHEILNESSSPLAPGMLKTREEIEKWLDKNSLSNGAIINPDLTVNHEGTVHLNRAKLKLREPWSDDKREFYIPVQFNLVRGDFFCGGISELESLRGAPRHVLGSFSCNDDQLTSLVGGPITVGGVYRAENNQLTSLEGVASTIGSSLHCYDNYDLNSLHNIHRHIKKIVQRAPGGTLVIDGSVKSNILGILKINGMRNVFIIHPKEGDLNAAVEILNKHLKGDRNIHACQEELIEAGLKEYAKL